MDHKHVPPLISISRLTTLSASILVALASGTNYVFSAYAPQLAARLQITHTQLNLIALGGNAGVYSTGPIWGRIVDKRGPRIPFISAFLLLLIGYSGMRFFYEAGVPPGASLPTWSLCTLIVLGVMSGAGGNAGFSASVNATAKSFPDSARATTTGIVMSGFGLSAFLFSSIAHIVFPSNTSGFLLILAIGTAFPMIIGFFFVKQVPLSASPGGIEHDSSLSSSHTPLLSSQEEDELVEGRSRDVELGSTRSRSTEIHRSRSRSMMKHKYGDTDIRGKALWVNFDFLLLFAILVALSGTGLMFINNVGSMAQVLYAHNNPTYDDTVAGQLQAAQVSSISIMSFSGRILIGLLSDFTTKKHYLRRSYCLTLIALVFFISQLVAASITTVDNLWKASVLLGLAYGGAFGFLPVLIIEFFGIDHFSENWGYLSLAPMVGGNVLSIAFGKNLDAHEPAVVNQTSPAVPLSSASACQLGRECYIDSIYLTIGTCFFAILLSVYAGWRDKQQRGGFPDDEVDSAARAGGDDVVWQSNGDD